MIDGGISKLFNGSDDLFKFLFVGGVFLLVFSLLYPMEKEKELKLKINAYNSDISELNFKDSLLCIVYDDNTARINELTAEGNTLKAKDQLEKAKELIPEYDSIVAQTSRIENERRLFQKSLSKKKLEIDILETYTETYGTYSFWMILIGIILGSIGLICWFISQYFSLRAKILETKDMKVNHDRNKAQGNNPTTS